MSTVTDPDFLNPKYSIVESLKGLIKDIDRSLAEIIKIPVTTDEKGTSITGLQTSYTELKSEINIQYATWSTTDLSMIATTLMAFNNRKDALDISRRSLLPSENNDFTFTGIARKTARKTLEFFAASSVFGAFMLGGTVMSNNYINESLPMRFFYFVYGAALFPVSLVYGIILTPTWHAGIFPLIERTKSRIPFFSYAKPSAYDPSGGNKIPLLVLCIVNLLMVFISLSLLSS